MAGQFGEDGNGQQRHQRRANAARFALIDKGGQVGSQGVEAEGKRNITGQWHGEGSCGRVHWDTLSADGSFQHRNHTKERCSVLKRPLSPYDFAHALAAAKS